MLFRSSICRRVSFLFSLISFSSIFINTNIPLLNKLKAYSDIEYLGEVIEHSWGQRVIRFYDLDEHLIEVGEDMQMVVKRFLASGMTMEEVSAKMDVSIEDLTKLLNS